MKRLFIAAILSAATAASLHAVIRLPSADGQFWDIQDTSTWAQDSGGIATGGKNLPPSQRRTGLVRHHRAQEALDMARLARSRTASAKKADVRTAATRAESSHREHDASARTG